MERSYAMEHSKFEFDWNAFLKRDLYTLEELARAFDLACCWVSCACGNQCSVIPRDSQGAPYDRTLRKNGNHFASMISLMYDTLKHGDETGFQKYRLHAKETLALIEERSKEIIEYIN